MNKDYSDNSESRILAKNMEKDLESHFCDMNKFPLCSVKVIGFTSASMIANVALNLSSNKTDVKQYLETKSKETKNTDLSNSGAKVENINIKELNEVQKIGKPRVIGNVSILDRLCHFVSILNTI